MDVSAAYCLPSKMSNLGVPSLSSDDPWIKNKRLYLPVNALYIVFLRFAEYLLSTSQSIPVRPFSNNVTNQESRDMEPGKVYTSLTEI